METGINVRILGCTLGFLVNLYAAFLAIIVTGIFGFMPRILDEVLPFWFNNIANSIADTLIVACNFTTCVMVIGILVALSKDINTFYIFVGFLLTLIVYECAIWCVEIYLPLTKATAKVEHHLSTLINNDIMLLERKGIDRNETLQEFNQQPMARLQRTLTCCGVDATKTWGVRMMETFKDLSNETFPISCCLDRNEQKSRHFCSKMEVHKSTCVDQVMFPLHRYFNKYFRIISTLFMFQVIILLYYLTKVYNAIT